MKNGCIFTECAVILGVAVAVGTGFHLFRSEKLRIKFIGHYPGAFEIAKKSAEQPPPPPPPPDPNTPEEPLSPGVVDMLEKKRGTQATTVSIDVSKDAAEPISVEKVEPGPAPGSVAKSGVPEIGVEEAYEFFKNDAPFLDARRTRFYQQGHIPRAKPMSVWEADLDKRIDDLIKEFPSDLAMVIYCTGGDCEDSHMLAGKLKTAGFTNLHIFLEGFPKWVAKKYPVEKSEGAGDEPAGGEESH